MNGPQQQVAIEVALTTLAFTLPISSLPSPDLTSEQIVASDRELGLAESQQQRSSSALSRVREWLHKSPDIGGTRKAQQNVSLSSCPRSDRKQQPPLSTRNDDSAASVDCAQLAGEACADAVSRQGWAWAGPRQADLSNFRQGFSGERVLAGWHRLPVDRSAPVMLWRVVLRK
jgi:hypothetical protein